MKDLLLWIVAGLVLVAILSGGGLSVSPTISPSLAGRLDVTYAPDQSVTTTTVENHIATNIERQVIYQAAPGAGAGVNLVDAGPGRCATQPGDVVESEQGQGACYVINGGQRYFVNPNGNRWPVDNGAGAAAGAQPALVPLATPGPGPLVPADPLSLEQLQAAFLRNGGELPALWNWHGAEYQRDWLSQQGATWR